MEFDINLSLVEVKINVKHFLRIFYLFNIRFLHLCNVHLAPPACVQFICAASGGEFHLAVSLVWSAAQDTQPLACKSDDSIQLSPLHRTQHAVEVIPGQPRAGRKEHVAGKRVQ